MTILKELYFLNKLCELMEEKRIPQEVQHSITLDATSETRIKQLIEEVKKYPNHE